VPVSLIGTFAVMYLAGFSLDNLSLMALTIASGFVVDDAIVMIENISRHIEKGEKPFAAALKGSGEIAFTIVSLTISLIAVLIPLLFMQEVVGRLFREFAITLAISILISAVVSLTLVPMLCAKILRTHEEAERAQGRLARRAEVWFNDLIAGYGRLLTRVLEHQTAVLWVAVGTVVLTVLLYVVIPKGFFPLQDTGLIQATTQGPPSISFKDMAERRQSRAAIIRQDPDVENLTSYVGVDGTNMTLNQGRMLIGLKPKQDRSDTLIEAMARLRQEAATRVPGISLALQPVQDLTISSIVSSAQYQFILGAADRSLLDPWVPKLLAALQRSPALAHVATTYPEQGLTAEVDVDHSTAARFGITDATT